MMDKTKCTLTDVELISKAKEWIYSLAKSKGDVWVLSIPVNFNKDPDIIFMELCDRLAAKSIAPPTTEQTELSDYDDQSKMWVDVIAVVISVTQLNNGLPSEALDMLKEKYTLTRKEEVPEAVEFADWIAHKHYYKDVYGEWYGCERGMTVLIAKTTAELYEIFKKQKP